MVVRSDGQSRWMKLRWVPGFEWQQIKKEPNDIILTMCNSDEKEDDPNGLFATHSITEIGQIELRRSGDTLDFRDVVVRTSDKSSQSRLLMRVGYSFALTVAQ